MYQYITGGCTTRKLPSIVELLLNNYRLLLIILIIILPAFKLQAQDFFPQQRDYGVRVGADVEIPGKNLEGYQPALSYNAGFMRFFDQITVGASLSYREFTPKMQVVVEQIDDAHQSTSTYSNSSTFLFYLDAVYNKPLTERLNFYGGLNAGIGYNTSSIHYQDDENDLYLGGGCKQIYVAPKIGLSLAISSYTEINVRAAYNLFMQSGNVTNNIYVDKTGVAPTSFSSVMAGVGLVFKF
jgi:hypothetical protein